MLSCCEDQKKNVGVDLGAAAEKIEDVAHSWKTESEDDVKGTDILGLAFVFHKSINF